MAQRKPPKRRSWKEAVHECLTNSYPGENGCMITNLAKSKGYGVLTFTYKTGKKKLLKAHRAVLCDKMGFGFEEYDTFTEVVRHTCDNPACVNPDHLLPGTHLDNMRDSRERKQHAHGEGHYAAKLTDDDVRLIKRLMKKGKYSKYTHRDVAKMFGITHRTVGLIMTGDRWNHIE